jgi:siroheme synthase
MARIAERLLAGGLAGETPVAAVHWGTTPRQQVLRTTLADVGRHRLPAPSTIVVGAVAATELDWFTPEPPPLPD